MERRIPPTLLPYIQNQSVDVLTVVTSTLVNDSSWLLVRYIAHVLQDHGVDAGSPQKKTAAAKVLLVSYLKDLNFWQYECKRTTGIDLEGSAREGRFAYLDDSGSRHGQTPRPVGTQTGSLKHPNAETSYLQNVDAALDALQTGSSGNPSVLVIIDSIDLLVGLATGTTVATPILASIARLRQHPAVHSVILAMSASLAHPFEATKTTPSHHELLDAQPQAPTSLDLAQQAVLNGALHSADMLISLRPLDTGAAGDVSGVVRITRGAAYGLSDDGADQVLDEGEWLFHVAGDGRVKMWERKAGVG